MVITKTPFRMSFFGGGTDIEDYFRINGGAVISTTFDKYCYVEVRHLPRFFDYSSEFLYFNTERVNDVEKIQHPLIRNAMKMLNMHEIRLSYDADLPARSGLGTSSSFSVGMLNAFYALKGAYAGKDTLSQDAIHLERVLCGEEGGWQDQIAVAYGGLNRIDFGDFGYRVHPIVISKERKDQLDKNLVLFFTGFTRISSEIQKQNMREHPENKLFMLKEMQGMVDEAEKILSNKNRNLDDFGTLLGESWELKRRTGTAVTNDEIDAYYKIGIDAGAKGGKLLGAGGGGFLVFYVTPDKQKSVFEALNGLMRIPFHFEAVGSQIIHYDPEEYEIPGKRRS